MNELYSIAAAELDVLARLNAASARYLVIGGLAVRCYSAERACNYVDILIDNSSPNVTIVHRVIREAVGQPIGFAPEDLMRPQQLVKLEPHGQKFDILSSIEDVFFEEAYARRVEFEERGVVLPVAAREDVIAMKLAAVKRDLARVRKDVSDLDLLR